MTTHLVLGNALGIAVATDADGASQLEEGFQDDRGGLLALSGPHRVVLAYAGSSHQLQVPVSSLLRMWEVSLGGRSRPTLDGYVSDFRAWLSDAFHSGLLTAPNRAVVFKKAAEMAEWLADVARRHLAGTHASDLSLEAFIEEDSAVVRSWPVVDGFEQLGGRARARRLLDRLWVGDEPDSESLECVVRRAFGVLVSDLSTTTVWRIFENLLLRLERWVLLHNDTTVLFIGFGSTDLLPGYRRLSLLGAFEDWLGTFTWPAEIAQRVGNGWFLGRSEGPNIHIDLFVRGFHAGTAKAMFDDSGRWAVLSASTLSSPPSEHVAALSDLSESRVMPSFRDHVSCATINELGFICHSLVGLERLFKIIHRLVIPSGPAVRTLLVSRHDGIVAFDP